MKRGKLYPQQDQMGTNRLLVLVPGRSLEPAGNGWPRWMVAGGNAQGRARHHRTPRTGHLAVPLTAPLAQGLNFRLSHTFTAEGRIGALPLPAKKCRAVKSAVMSSTLSSSANHNPASLAKWEGPPAMGLGGQRRRCRMESRGGFEQVLPVIAIHEFARRLFWARQARGRPPARQVVLRTSSGEVA